MSSQPNDVSHVDVDVAVVGAGMGGMYAVHRFREAGLRVQGFEGAPEVGGVWYHNRYPGARVDVESRDYAFHFDTEFYRNWVWSERYAAQPEILAYLNHFADHFDLRPLYRFNTWVEAAQWEPEGDRYRISTDDGAVTYARSLVMASGQLSRARKPNFPGLDDFTGEWVQTSHWPQHEVPIAGRRIGVIGTGASGVQAITAMAPDAAELVVFQRTANYSIPAHNDVADPARQAEASADSREYYAGLSRLLAASHYPPRNGKAAEYTPQEQRELLEKRWAFGGHAMNTVFADQGLDLDVNTIVSDFVREKIRGIVSDAETAEKLMPRAYPIGTRRLIVDTGYFETFNRDNVTLVDVRADPIERITATGVATATQHFDLDLIVFAIGFDAFTGALESANITNEFGRTPVDYWREGPRTYLGLMTSAFPNLFILTGPQSPSVLANMIVSNVQHVDLVERILARMNERGATRVTATPAAEAEWVDHANEVSRNILRRQVDNYMVHINADGSRIFIPYVGGFSTYVERVEQIVADDFAGFEFSRAGETQAEPAVARATA